MKYRSSQFSRNVRGFTLLEVLIAIIIFSIGLLGIASLQLNGMKQTHNSHLRAVATLLTQDIADRMRANKGGFKDGKYNVTTIPTNWTTDCEAADCTAEQLAIFDLVKWNNGNAAGNGEGLDDLLPLGSGIVCRDSTPNDGAAGAWACDDGGEIYAIKIQWTERGLDAEENATFTKRFVMRVMPW